MKEVRFVDTTFRDGHASLWAEGMRTGMMLAVADEMDQAGFVAMDVIASSHFKKCVRELREDPWERIRLLARRLPHTPLAALSRDHPGTFGIAPRSIVRLYFERLAANGIQRLQLIEPSNDIVNRLTEPVRFARELGLEVVVGLVYSLSPRHTDAYYAERGKDAMAIGANNVYLKDPGGLLTPERVRTIVPAILGAVDGIELELHTHCTTGLGPLCCLAAIEAGVSTVHTAVPPLADGPSQPSVFNVAQNARLLGFASRLDEEKLRGVSEKLHSIARREGLPVGQPVEYDYSQYIHQIPGGVISNLRHQLATIGSASRLAEVVEETVEVRRDLGYPIMVTPFSQFVVSQAAINVTTGERYRVVTDEIIRYTLGFYGAEAATGVDKETREHILDRSRAMELASWEPPEPSLAEVRQSLGGAAFSDDELLLRYMVEDEEDLTRMRQHGPIREYRAEGSPVVDLIGALCARRDVARIAIQKPGLLLDLQTAGSGGSAGEPAKAARSAAKKV